MRYGFNTTDQSAAVAALLVYAVWRSRDRARFKITPDVWGQIERFTKASAKRARELSDFIEDFKPKLHCATIHPRAMAVGIAGAPVVRFDGGAFAELESERETQREFLTGVLADADEPAVLYRLYRNTALVILLVRERLERERPVEARFDAVVSGEDDGDADGGQTFDGAEAALSRPAASPKPPAGQQASFLEGTS